jgi:V/A-type H+-transporting ATPase subunit D
MSSFERKILPTKITLIRLKRSLAFAKKVKKILEDKREVILHELDKLIEEVTEEKKKIYEPLYDAYCSLYEAYMSESNINLNSLITVTPYSAEVKIKEENLMGVKIPRFTVKFEKGTIPYGFIGTPSSLDRAIKKFQEIIPLLISCAEKENAIYKLAEELKKTQRQVNALKHIIIPNYERAIYNIVATLEEREREDFVRLKKIKAVLERRAKYGK